jgi:hypothetical protein
MPPHYFGPNTRWQLMLAILLALGFCYFLFLIIDTRFLFCPPSGHLDWCLELARKDRRILFMPVALAVLLFGFLAAVISLARRRPAVEITTQGLAILTNFRDLRASWREIDRVEKLAFPKRGHAIHMADGTVHKLPRVQGARLAAIAIDAALTNYGGEEGGSE